MDISEMMDKYLNSGDPAIKDWFLIRNNFLPLFLCCMYLFVIKVVGPYFMKNRKPYELRTVMIVYNFFLVIVYAISVYVTLKCLSRLPFSEICKQQAINLDDCSYTAVIWGWIIYLIKYVEFLDTIFFVLRKKNNLITNLHVIHHFVLPLIGWIFFRTERSGFQIYPVLLNSHVHIIMYSYYGLAAIGPSVRKYLWWKRYLTILQMTQFVLILIFVTLIRPMFGCTTARTSITINIVFAILFLALFFNFYKNSFKPTKRQSNQVYQETTLSFKNEGNQEYHLNECSKIKKN